MRIFLGGINDSTEVFSEDNLASDRIGNHPGRQTTCHVTMELGVLISDEDNYYVLFCEEYEPEHKKVHK